MLLLMAAFLLPVAPAWANDTAELDPWENFNRRIFAFDMSFDKYVFKPAAISYRKVTPHWGQRMVTNLFNNVKDLRGGINALLQARFAQAGSNFSRTLINTTLGVGGLFDVATDAGIKSYDQDFGLTLARWGVESGPYLVLPFMGPSTVRDTAGLIPGTYAWAPHYLPTDKATYAANGLYAVSIRASLLDLEKSIVGDKYIFVRDYYLQSRALAAGHEAEDDFGAGLDADDASDWGDDDW